MSIPFDRALLLTMGGTLLAALVAGGVTLDRRLATELEQDARKDLAMAPPVLTDRLTTQAEALRMHALELARHPEVGQALAAGDREGAISDAQALAEAWSENPILVGTDGQVWIGPGPSATLSPETTLGEGPYTVVYDDGALTGVALASVLDGDRSVGAAGVALPLDRSVAEIVAGLTRAEVIFLGPDDRLVASTLDSVTTAGLLAALAASPTGGGAPAAGAGTPSAAGTRTGAETGAETGADPETPTVVDADVPGIGRFWSVRAALGSVGSALFVHSAERELAALPRLRRAAMFGAGLALLVTLLVGLGVARAFSRPIRALADASLGLARGDFDAPLPESRVSEIDTVAEAFAEMRTALAARLSELAESNRELADRQERLQALQTEMIQRDRLVAAGRLVTELAHEIRNPVANVRNSLEVVRRHVDSEKAREFTDLAIGELLRMHELAERMLDLNRPEREGEGTCDARTVLDDVAALVELGDREGRWPLTLHGPDSAPAAIAADALKQVVLNLIANAQEACPDGCPIEVRLTAGSGGTAAGGDRDGGAAGRGPVRVRIDVLDRGGGIDPDTLPHIFDPFFTTKAEVHGVGLGLFIAQGVVRGAGGSLSATARDPGPGTVVTIEVPAETTSAASAGGRSAGRSAGSSAAASSPTEAGSDGGAPA